jgi:hypothetical protein
MNQLQSVASVVRQVLAVLVSVYGVLSASISQLHLPPAVSAALTAFGPVLLTVEHYVSDPSTGTPVTTTTTTTPVVAPPVTPVVSVVAPPQSSNPVTPAV